MGETRIKGGEGFIYRYITETNAEALREFQRQYEAMGKRTWLTQLEENPPKWVLKVEEVTI